MNAHMPSGPDQDPTEFWEELYQQRSRVWSGKANKALVDVAGDLAPGRALDLGSGEGGDALWLAGLGWRVDGLEISSTALARAVEHTREQERDRGLDEGTLAERIHWRQADLVDWVPDAQYDLVSACFLHSPVEFPRDAVLRRAADAVAPGGHLLVVGHAAFPPWSAMHCHDDDGAPSIDDGNAPEAGHDHEGGHGHAPEHGDHADLPSADEVAAALALPPAEWRVLVSENRPRDAVGPDGQEAVIDDAVLLVQRLPTPGSSGSQAA